MNRLGVNRMLQPPARYLRFLRCLLLSSESLRLLCFCLSLSAVPGQAQPLPLNDLYLLTPGSSKAVNALWGENPLSLQFKSSRTVTVADLSGPGIITMIHFAYPGSRSPNQSLSRDLLLRIYWDGSPTRAWNVPWWTSSAILTVNRTR